MMSKLLNKMFIMFVGAMLLLPSLVSADEEPYRFGIVDLKPYAYNDSEGNLHGSVPKYLQGLCDKLNVECKANIYPLKRMLTMLYYGDLDMALLPEGVYDETKLVADNQAVALLDVGFFTSNMSNFNPNVLDDVRLIVVRDYAYSGILEKMVSENKHLKIIYASSLSAAFKMLDLNRGDAILAYNDYAINYIDNIERLNYYPVYKAHIYPCYSKSFLAGLSEYRRKYFLTTHSKFAKNELENRTHQKDHYTSADKI